MKVNRKYLTDNIFMDNSILDYCEHNGHIKDSYNHNIPKISIIIPLYNEENSIRNVIERIPKYCNSEILIIDDGSSDNSIEEIKKNQDKFIRIIKHKENQGYGAALMTGFKHVQGDFIITLDSDGQHNPEEIPKLINPIMDGEADLAIGSRYLGNCSYQIPLHVRMGEFFIRKVIKCLYHKEIANNQCGYRALNRSLLKHFQDFYDCGMAFSTEFLLKTLEMNKEIMEVPITLNPREYGTSYVNLARILRKICMCLIIYGMRKLKFPRKFIDNYLSFIFKRL